MGSILDIGISGLNAAQAGLVTTQQNIANASTPGYNRQQIVQSTAAPQFTGAGFLGQGAQVDTVKRIYSEFLGSQVLQSQTQASFFESYSAQIEQIDNMLADANVGLSPAAQGFFTGVQEVANYPASIPARQSLLSTGQAMVAKFQGINQRFTEMRDGANGQITSTVTDINALAQQIAKSNQIITVAESAAQPTQQANDLRDQRDNLVLELNKLVQAKVVQQRDGSFNVFIGNGQTLVVGYEAFSLAVKPSLEDPEKLDIAYVTPGGAVLLNPDSLQGGKLGGILAFRKDALDSAQNALGRVAIGLAQTFNDQHRLGEDLEDQLGGNFFNVAIPKVINKATNKGDAVISASFADVGVITTSDYKLLYDGTEYTLTRLSDNTITKFPTLPKTVDGFTMKKDSGTPAAGDSFLIQPTRNGARDIALIISDPVKVAAAAPVRSNATLTNTGNGKISPGVVIDTTNPAFATTPKTLTPPILAKFTSPTQYDLYDNTNPASPVLLENNIPYDPVKGSEIFPTPGGLDYGYRVKLNNAPLKDDTFTIDYNSKGVSDNRNALLLGALQSKNTLAGRTTSYQGAFSQLVSQVGNKAREVQVNGNAQDALLAQARQSQQGLSGVNLDEEASNLIRYQQAYQAAGKMMQVSDTLFQTLLGLGK